MGIKQLSKELSRAVRQTHREVEKRFNDLGNMGVAYAKANGQYHDVTGNLRRSNTYMADDTCLILANTADYASDVEARGEDVLTGAILEVRKEIAKQ